MAAFACTLRIVDGHGSAEDAKAGLRYAEEALAERNDDAIVLSYAGSALGSLGYRGLGIALLGFRYDEAERAIEQALGLCPNLLSVQFCAGNIRNILGDGDRALGHFDRVMRISPLDPATGGFIACTGAAHLVAGRYECAVKASRRALQDVPNLALAHVVLLSALRRMGRADDAKLGGATPARVGPSVHRVAIPSDFPR
jgi:adenylate cyclase